MSLLGKLNARDPDVKEKLDELRNRNNRMYYTVSGVNVAVCLFYAFVIVGLQISKEIQLRDNETAICNVKYAWEMIADMSVGLTRVFSNILIIYATYKIRQNI